VLLYETLILRPSFDSRRTYDGEYISQVAYVTMRAPKSPVYDEVGSPSGHLNEKTAMPSPNELPAVANYSLGNSSVSKPAPWIMPWETGDRENGELAPSMSGLYGLLINEPVPIRFCGIPGQITKTSYGWNRKTLT